MCVCLISGEREGDKSDERDDAWKIKGFHVGGHSVRERERGSVCVSPCPDMGERSTRHLPFFHVHGGREREGSLILLMIACPLSCSSLSLSFNDPVPVQRGARYAMSANRVERLDEGRTRILSLGEREREGNGCGKEKESSLSPSAMG